MARQGALHVTGSYMTGGKSTRSLRGVYRDEMGTTVRVASSRVEGQVFHENLTPAGEEGGMGVSMQARDGKGQGRDTCHLVPRSRQR